MPSPYALIYPDTAATPCPGALPPLTDDLSLGFCGLDSRLSGAANTVYGVRERAKRAHRAVPVNRQAHNKPISRTTSRCPHTNVTRQLRPTLLGCSYSRCAFRLWVIIHSSPFQELYPAIFAIDAAIPPPWLAAITKDGAPLSAPRRRLNALDHFASCVQASG